MTIYALSTIEGQSGIAIIRVSGTKAKESIRVLTGRNPKPRHAELTNITSSKKEIIDQAITLFFPEGKSFTGESVAEFHMHGSSAVIKKVLLELSKIKGLRLAKPGEFTKIAYINGKLNLLQVEGLRNLIRAETEEQRRQAYRHYSDQATNKYFMWLENLRDVLALVEASIDFSDEEIPRNIYDVVKKKINKTKLELKEHLKSEKQGTAIRDGIKIAILGRTNSGKSSLINYLSKKELSIVTKKPGTTRDVLSAKMEFSGIPVTIYDTAGIRNTKDEIEKEGKRRALITGSIADIRVFIGDNSLKKPFRDINLTKNNGDLVVMNKADLKKANNEKRDVTISLKNNMGLDRLMNKIMVRVKEISSVYSGPVITSEREFGHVYRALSSLERINYQDPALDSEDINQALIEIGLITEKTHNEEILGRIFNDFCIGK